MSGRQSILRLPVSGDALVDISAPAAELTVEQVDEIIEYLRVYRGHAAKREGPKLLCEHCSGEGRLAVCPYDSEIHNRDRECSCCDGCRHECARDI